MIGCLVIHYYASNKSVVSLMPKIIFLSLFIAATCTGCAGLAERNPVPLEIPGEARISGIPAARYWADDVPPNAGMWKELSTEELRERFPDAVGKQHNYLAISGGGPRGAFAAGFLNGWTKAGTRPDFVYVTGVSTGALIAPFAFLGPDYDHILEEVYTGISTEDILKKRSLINIFRLDAAADSTPLRQLIEKYIDEQTMQAIADKYRRGSSLIILTTNLDAGRSVGWDIGEIATSGDPKALQLIRNVLLASAAIPAAFPPVMMEVEANGQSYDEMHVDGGVTSQLHLYPLALNLTEAIKRYEVVGTPTVYVIRNGYVEARYQSIERRTLAIAVGSMSTLMGNISYGDMYRIYLETQRDGIEFKLAYVPDSFSEPLTEPFDTEYMKKLYKLGYESAVNGYEWKSAPPGYLLE
jgi:predicted patatin/cPLA2 family phospholipase